MDTLALTLVLMAAFCWGTAQVLGKLALRDLSPLVFNTIRFSFVAAVFAPIVVLTGNLESCRPELILLAIGMGALGTFIGVQFFYNGMKRSLAHRIIPIGNAYPFWVIIFAPLLLSEAVKPILPAAIALVIGGTFLLTPTEKGSGQWRAGVAFASIAAMVWGLNSVLSKYIVTVEGMSILTLLMISLVTAALLYNLTALIKRPWRGVRLNRRNVGLSLLSGVISFPIGHTLYLTALGTEQVSALAPLTATTILFGFVLSLILARERPTHRAFLGTGVIFLGVFLAIL